MMVVITYIVLFVKFDTEDSHACVVHERVALLC